MLNGAEYFLTMRNSTGWCSVVRASCRVALDGTKYGTGWYGLVRDGMGWYTMVRKSTKLCCLSVTGAKWRVMVLDADSAE